MGQSGYISVGSEQLHYLKWGNGKRLLLAFHGYGDNADIFSPLPEYLDESYTMLSFNLPYHGGSAWAGNSLLTDKDIVEMVHVLMNEYHVEKVSLIGYSLGGRVCLAIIEYLPASIEKVVLIAPDGLKVDPYYYFFTGTWPGKKIFRNMLEQPKPYFRMMNWLKKMHLVHESRYKFAMHFLQSEESRSFLLHVWPALSGVAPRPAQLKKLIKKYHLPVVIFMGAYDKIIPPSIALKFKKGLDTVQLHIVEKGHRILDHETVRQIAGSL